MSEYIGRWGGGEAEGGLDGGGGGVPSSKPSRSATVSVFATQ